MVQRKKKELLPTLKISVKSDDENGIIFNPSVHKQATILKIEDVETKFGMKPVATLEFKDRRMCVFVNNVSMGYLIDAYGEDDKTWIGKIVNLSKETDDNFDKEMIVMRPLIPKD